MPAPVTLGVNEAGSGVRTVTASAGVFTSDDVGRLLRIKTQAFERLADAAYAEGDIRYADDRGVRRIYRCIQAGTSRGEDLAGTTPDYDLNTPNEEVEDVADGGIIWKYLGRGRSCWSWGKIQSVLSGTQCTVDITPNAPVASALASTAWQLGEWGGTRGWPRTVSVYNQRTFWGGSAANPQTVWSSQTGDFETMSPTEPDGTVLDTNALTHTIDDDQLNTILWMLNHAHGLAIGAPGAEFMLGPAVATQALGPHNSRIAPKSRRGSITEAPAVRSGEKGLLFVQRGGRIQREFNLDYQGDEAATPDLTVLSEHIADTGIVGSAAQQAPFGVLWHVRADGVLCALTYDSDQKIRGWTRHQLGGGGQVESLCAVPGPDGASDDIYLSVFRELTSGPKRWIEVIRAPFRAERDGDTGAFQVDAGLTYEGAPATTISGLAHLEGETVSVRADNVDLGAGFVVSGGEIVLPAAAAAVHVGLPFESVAITLPVEAGAEAGTTAQGRVKRAHEVVLRLLETQGGEVGRDATFEPIEESAAPGALFTGDSRQPNPADFDRLGQIAVRHTGNGPMTLLAIVQDLKTNG